jgi:hypothetical protein
MRPAGNRDSYESRLIFGPHITDRHAHSSRCMARHRCRHCQISSWAPCSKQAKPATRRSKSQPLWVVARLGLPSLVHASGGCKTRVVTFDLSTGLNWGAAPELKSVENAEVTKSVRDLKIRLFFTKMLHLLGSRVDDGHLTHEVLLGQRGAPDQDPRDSHQPNWKSALQRSALDPIRL